MTDGERELTEQKKQFKEQQKAERRKIREEKKFVRWFAFLRFISRVVGIFAPFRRHMECGAYGPGPYVFLSNHYGVLDVMYPALAMKKPIYFIAKKQLWEKAFLRWFCTKSRCIPVDRDGSVGDVKAVMQSMKCLRNGDNILIFPEGTRNTGDEPMLPFKGGFAAIAIKTRTPIVPIVTSGKTRIFHKTHVIYGKPIEFSEYYGRKLTDEIIADCETRVRNIMLEMKERAVSYSKKGKK